MQTRFTRFQNVPELLTLYRQVADARTNDDLDLPVPTLAGGQAQTIVVDPSDTLLAYVTDLASRADALPNRSVDPTEDNMLKTTGARHPAAVHLRLPADPPPPPAGQRTRPIERTA